MLTITRIMIHTVFRRLGVNASGRWRVGGGAPRTKPFMAPVCAGRQSRLASRNSKHLDSYPLDAVVSCSSVSWRNMWSVGDPFRIAANAVQSPWTIRDRYMLVKHRVPRGDRSPLMNQLFLALINGEVL